MTFAYFYQHSNSFNNDYYTTTNYVQLIQSVMYLSARNIQEHVESISDEARDEVLCLIARLPRIFECVMVDRLSLFLRVFLRFRLHSR
jgi:hypothetical protein